MNRANRRALERLRRKCAKDGHLTKRGVDHCLECGAEVPKAKR